MEQRRFTMFMVAAVAILAGWMWLQYQIWPPPTPKTPTDWKKFGPVAVEAWLRTNRIPTGDGLVDFARLAVDVGIFTRDKPDLPTPKPPREFTAVAWLMCLPSPGTLGLFGYPQFVPKLVKEASAKTFTIGSDKTFIRAELTSRGAGVQRLILNQFKGANWLGEPLDTPLELIPEDTEVASFLMYHYPNARKPEFPIQTLGRRIWTYEGTADKAGTQEVSFSTTLADGLDNLRITKTYRLRAKDYHLTLVLEVKNESDKDTSFRYQLAGAHGLPIEGEWYTNTNRNAVIGLVDKKNNLYRTLEEAQSISTGGGGTRVPEEDRGNDYLQYAGVITQYFASVIVLDNVQPDKKLGGVKQRENILAWARPTLETTEKAGILAEVDSARGRILVKSPGGGAAFYRALPRVLAHIKEAKIPEGADVVVSSYVGNSDTGERVATWIRHATALRPYFDDITVRVNSEAVDLKAGERIAHQFMLYNGPVKTSLLGQFRGDKAVDDDELVDRYTNTLHLNTLTDYRSAGPFGYFSQSIGFTKILITVTRFMHWLLNLLHLLVGNYGLSIILLTLIVRGLMFPISRKQAYFSVKMQELAPEMKKLQEKYKADKRGRTEATMELYRKHKVNPFGSCLPLLMQLPIFLGLYYALQESIHFRLAPFLWISNLAAPDMLMYWGESIPLISDPDNVGSLLSILYLGPYFNLLPIFAVTLMIVQQKLMTPPAMDEQQEMQQKMMKYMMIFVGILFYKVASGLCVYFITSSLWGLAERKMLPKRKPMEPLEGVAPSRPVSGPGGTPKGKGPKGKGPNKKDDKPDGKMQKVKDWWEEVLKKASKK